MQQADFLRSINLKFNDRGRHPTASISIWYKSRKELELVHFRLRTCLLRFPGVVKVVSQMLLGICDVEVPQLAVTMCLLR